MDPTLALAQELISCPSVTPDDAGCQNLLAGRLATLGFRCERLRFGAVDNLWATHGSGAPMVVLAGHTDVVPAGPREAWDSDPFTPAVREGKLFGRGAADMKSSIAAFVTAVEGYLGIHPRHAGTIAFLITSDEEGIAVDGTVRVVEWLKAQGIRPDYAIVGEPSCVSVLGDTVKPGRRGSLTGRLRVHGVQGHVAYPQLADNPLHRFAPALAELVAISWDQGSADFPPTTFQISNMAAGTGADNVIPGHADLVFNFRFSTAVTVDDLKREVHACLDRHGVRHTIDWWLSGQPFLTRPGRLRDITREAISSVLGREPEFSTGGGTSDARFLAPLGTEVIEFGPLNATIHKVNEHVSVADLPRLSAVYGRMIEMILAR